MLRAGSLRKHKVVFYKRGSERNRYGEVERDKLIELYETRAGKRKRYARVYREDLLSKEEFYSSSLTLVVRWHPKLAEAELVRFDGELFSIIYRDDNEDGSYDIGTKKIDDVKGAYA